jgi:hypothetical protein
VCRLLGVEITAPFLAENESSTMDVDDPQSVTSGLTEGGSLQAGAKTKFAKRVDVIA